MFFPIRAFIPVMVPATLAALLAVCVTGVDAADSLAGNGVSMIPEDAAFVSATLRAREQYDRFEKSNVWAALRKLPGVSDSTWRRLADAAGSLTGLAKLGEDELAGLGEVAIEEGGAHRRYCTSSTYWVAPRA